MTPFARFRTRVHPAVALAVVYALIALAVWRMLA